ncbi:MAG: M1 family metallopeptidase [Pseudomonadota bacterium]
MTSSFRLPFVVSSALALLASGCGGAPEEDHSASAAPQAEVSPTEPAPAPDAPDLDLFDPESADRLDHFSYANFDEIAVREIALDLTLDFEARVMRGRATLSLERLDPSATRLVLDTDDLVIGSVEVLNDDAAWAPAAHLLGDDDPVLGAKLEIDLPIGAEAVRISYETDPGAAGLQWLSPEQTASDDTPFVYSQAQAIHARSMAPLQDTPGLRVSYKATIRVEGADPSKILVLMGAAQDPDGVRDGEFTFDMPQPVPPYLIAIAAGDIVFREINETIGVYGEPYIVEAAADEFAETPKMEEIAERLYGPYRWGRYDMIVLPPSFPFGGMENPRLSFLTPTLVAGDRSLTNVVAHELAHSWSGNLVTNATWRDAWLNEGFTSYVENRIMEELYGPERASMERALDLASLRGEIDAMEDKSLSQLKLPASIPSTDAAFTLVAYIKGMFFLKRLEEAFGREAFDPFLKAYFDKFAFKSVVTEDFLAFLKAELMADQPNAVSEEEIAEWVLGPGLPETIEDPVSDRFAKVTLQQAEWLAGSLAAADIDASNWTTHEWLHFINTLPDAMKDAQFADLDAAFSFTGTRNAETAFAWYMKAIPAGYEPAFPALEDFLMRVGRGKFIYRLYAALQESESRRGWAREVYQRARAGYHPIAQRRIDGVLASGG